MYVLCFGDSNTYGYDPRSYFGGRYDPNNRWVDILEQRTGWDIRNEGMNGRMIPNRGISLPEAIDLLIIMLGTNDLLQGADSEETASRMGQFLKGISVRKDKILLVAPPAMKVGAWVTEEVLLRESRRLVQLYEDLAMRLDIRFVDANHWNVAITFDGVHFSEEGHRNFAEGIYSYLVE